MRNMAAPKSTPVGAQHTLAGAGSEAEAGKEAVATTKTQIICSFYQSGICNLGKECKSLHRRIKTKVCTFYQSGICKGKKCKFLHTGPQGDKGATSTQGPKGDTNAQGAIGLTRKSGCFETEITPGTSMAVTTLVVAEAEGPGQRPLNDDTKEKDDHENSEDKCKHVWTCLRDKCHNKGNGKGKYRAYRCSLCKNFQRRY